MRKILLFCFAINIYAVAIAQIDYSGNYGFQDKIFNLGGLETKPDKSDAGPTGTLTLLKIDSFQYKFWLSANRGWPSYNEGDIDGIISVRNGYAFFNEKQDYTDSSCKIEFSFFSKYILVDQLSNDFDCGFGFHVFANGKYRKKNSAKIKNSDLEELYIDFTNYSVSSGRSYLYEDTSSNRMKKQYFIKGDKVLGFKETAAFIYVEYITASGKFIYGWLKKSELKDIE